MKLTLLKSGLAALALACALNNLSAANSRILWQIGKADTNNAEFALAPNGWTTFRADGFFVVGASAPARDWPYVQPGPDDRWAGGRAHTFTIAFGVKSAVADGECTPDE